MVLAIPISMFVPVVTPSLANDHKHWRGRQKRAQEHRLATKIAWRQAAGCVPEFPIEVILTRVSARELDDDNLRSALKHVRDGVAELLGVDDRDPRVRWSYAWEKKPPKSTTGVRVTIGEMPVICPTCGRKTEAA